MENFFSRYKNPLALMAILFIQVVALATQVKRPESSTGAAASGGTRLIRVWTVTAISPFERALVSTGSFIRRNFYNYIDLHNVRKQNQQLQEQVAQLKLERVRLQTDADQARRLRALLGFTQHYVGQLLPAQVIGTSGAEMSHMIQVDKGSTSGIRVDMPVITPDGVVGKVKDVFPYVSMVLLISDRDSGAGVILENSRLQSVLRGSPRGELRLSDIMSDEDVAPGEAVVTSGGDGIFPKGLPVGTVSRVSPDHNNQPFLAVTVKPAADLSRLEEVLIVTKVSQDGSSKGTDAGAVRAADILSERLPSVPKPEDTKKSSAAKTSSASTHPAPTTASHSGAATPARPATAGEPKVAPNALKPGETNLKKTGVPAAATAGAFSSRASSRPLPSQPKAAAPAAERELGTGTTPAQGSAPAQKITNKPLVKKSTVPANQKPAASPVKKATPHATPGASPSAGAQPAQPGAAGGPPR
ncbi:MAG TPA: rod shape-determining protein MreC [Candidatus Angelobacter sp.]|nr:rod shape-determining protein MreC [Candidatus Angelobacter sp.]